MLSLKVSFSSLSHLQILPQGLLIVTSQIWYFHLTLFSQQLLLSSLKKSIVQSNFNLHINLGLSLRSFDSSFETKGTIISQVTSFLYCDTETYRVELGVDEIELYQKSSFRSEVEVRPTNLARGPQTGIYRRTDNVLGKRSVVLQCILHITLLRTSSCHTEGRLKVLSCRMMAVRTRRTMR